MTCDKCEASVRDINLPAHMLKSHDVIRDADIMGETEFMMGLL